MSKSANTAVKGEPVRLKKRSYWGEVWHQLKKNPVSVICLIFLALLVLATVFSTWIAPYDYAQQDLMLRFAKPSLQHIMGCDAYGRDLFSRLLVGGRYSLMVAVISVAIGIVFGMIVGALCGFFGKLTDNILMRFMDVIMAIPGMMMAICISVSLGSGVWQTALAIAVGTIPVIARQLRGSTLLIHDQEYIEAARSFGGEQRQNHSHPCHPQHPGAHHCPDLSVSGRLHHGHCRPVLHRTGRTAAHAGVGQHPQQRYGQPL